jgi:hypothetical protein
MVSVWCPMKALMTRWSTPVEASADAKLLRST